jgi:hypothetical protein
MLSVGKSGAPVTASHPETFVLTMSVGLSSPGSRASAAAKSADHLRHHIMGTRVAIGVAVSTSALILAAQR